MSTLNAVYTAGIALIVVAGAINGLTDRPNLLRLATLLAGLGGALAGLSQ